jgi:outer membrane biosynthesis protein TonB
MRPLRILTFIGFIAVCIGLAVRLWIDGLPSVEQFRSALPELPTGSDHVVTASEQLGGPPATRGPRRPQGTSQSSGPFTIRLGRAPVASATPAAGATGSGETPTAPPVVPPPSASPPPAPAPTPPTPPVAPPTPPAPAPAPNPGPPAAPSAPSAPAPTAAPSPPKPKPKPAPKPAAPAPATPAQPSGSPEPSTPGAPSTETSKPGWGKGDENHDHTGPPGANGSDKKESGKKP